jgi:hypothetical protein
LLFVVACTVDNPLYTPSVSSANPDLLGVVTDLASTSDLAKPGCVDGKRACTGMKTESVLCENGTFVADRTCPSGSSCGDGYCGVPSAGSNNTGLSCDGPSGPNATLCFNGASMPLPDCQPFVQAGAIVWACAAPVGNGIVGTMCTQGSKCRSGFCGSNGTCFRACGVGSDCPTSVGKWVCSPVKITVEGVDTTVHGCVPG